MYGKLELLFFFLCFLFDRFTSTSGAWEFEYSERIEYETATLESFLQKSQKLVIINYTLLV